MLAAPYSRRTTDKSRFYLSWSETLMLLPVITTGLFAKHKTNDRADVSSWNNYHCLESRLPRICSPRAQFLTFKYACIRSSIPHQTVDIAALPMSSGRRSLAQSHVQYLCWEIWSCHEKMGACEQTLECIYASKNTQLQGDRCKYGHMEKIWLRLQTGELVPKAAYHVCWVLLLAAFWVA